MVWSRPEAPWYLPPVTIAAYGLACAIRLAYRPTAFWAAAVCGHAAAAVALAGYGLQWPVAESAVALGAISGAMVLLGWALARSEQARDSFTGAFASATATAIITLIMALRAVTTPGEGEAALLAMVIAGSVWASLYVLRQGAGYAHAAFAAYFLAYAIFLYDRLSLNTKVLDLYLIPVGFYLLILGHTAAKTGVSGSAQGLWWLGLLLVMSPTYLAFYVHFTSSGPPWHAVLLVAESILAVLWGIANRIRAFVLAGTLFALGFAAVLVASAITQVWIGIVSVAAGLLLLAGVYWLSVKTVEARTVIERALREWQQWR